MSAASGAPTRRARSSERIISAVGRIEVAVSTRWSPGDGTPRRGALAGACSSRASRRAKSDLTATVADLERHLDGVVQRTEPEQIVIEALGEVDELGHVMGALGDRDDVGDGHPSAGEDPRQRALVP